MINTTNANDQMFWRKVAEDLEIQIISPYELRLSDETTLYAQALVKNFGARNGMIVVDAYETVKPHVQTLIEFGYGYSSTIDGKPDTYDRQQMIDVFGDWGWSGIKRQRPTWLK